MKQRIAKYIMMLSFFAGILVSCNSKLKSKSKDRTTPEQGIADPSDAAEPDETVNAEPGTNTSQSPTPSSPLPSNTELKFGPSLFSYANMLSNGNLVITNSKHSGAMANLGRITLHKAKSGERVSEVLGDQEDDFLGLNGHVAELSNGNFVVRNAEDNAGSLDGAGSVILISGSTGKEMARISGNQAGDGIGKNSVGKLSNGNYYIVSTGDNCLGKMSCGSVILVNGTSGAEISRLEGNHDNDRIGWRGVKVLPNGNYVVFSPFDSTDTLNSTGSASLISATTGAEIGKIEGTQTNENMAGRGNAVLSNGNFVVSSASAVVLVNGSTGLEISRFNEAPSSHVNSTGVKGLKNGNYVIHNHATTNGIVGSGFTILVNGATGVEIARISGDDTGDEFGYYDIVEIENGNYVMRNPSDDSGGMTDNGSVILIDGTTGVEIARISGDQSNNKIGYNGVFPLSNGNFVVASSLDDTASLTDNGSVILVNGITGAEISRIEGDQNNDRFGLYRVFETTSGRYVIRSPLDNTDQFLEAGSVVIADGLTGAQLYRLNGDHNSDQVSVHGFYLNIAPDINDSRGVLELPNGNMLISSNRKDKASLVDCGATILINGTTFEEIVRFDGDSAEDRVGWHAVSIDTKRFAVINPYDDENGFKDNGSILIVNADDGKLIKKIIGLGDNSLLGAKVFKVGPTSDYLYVSDVMPDHETIRIIPL